MEVSTLIIGLLIVALICLVITTIVLKFMRPNMVIQLEPSSGDLSVANRIGNTGDVRDKFLATPSGTFMCYINYVVQSKTPILGDAEPVYIVKMGNTLQLQLVPGSTTESPKTQLAVRTQGADAKTETILVSDLPQQKWIHLAIVKEGRRYTVYYNGKIVGSSRTQQFPFINSSQLVLGEPRIYGRFVGPKVIPTALTEDEIRAELEKTSNTRHEPYSSFNFWSVITSPLTMGGLGCPNGPFCSSTDGVPSTNPLKGWTTPYA